MRTPIFATVILLFVAHFVNAAIDQSAADTTKKNSSDTTRIYFGPNYQRHQTDLIYASATVNDPTLFHLSAGVNILNTSRGQSPNLLMSNNAYGTTASLRTGTPLYVIDGVSTRNPGTFYNLNAFEYQHISVINSGNVAARYAGGGLNSAIFLQRKSGANVEGPSIEFTSFTTYASNEVTNNYWDESEKKLTQWMFTNGIAYAQDFGAVDSRVSYTYGRFPSVDDAYEGATIHTTSINTGLEAGGFKARLILDQFTRLNEKPSPLAYFNGDAGNGSSQTERFLQGNLALSYHFSNWFNLSSITVANYLDDELSRVFYPFGSTPLERETYDHQRRVMSSLFVSGATPDDKKIQLNYSIGFQTDNTSLDYQTAVLTDNGGIIIDVTKWITEDITTKSFLAETGVDLKDKLLLTFNYQHNDFGSLTNKTYAVGFMFDFNNTFHLGDGVFSTGRFRGNYGKADVMNNTVFPYALESDFVAGNNVLTEGRHVEGGFDLGFMNNRFNLNITYFYNLGNDRVPIHEFPFPPIYPARHLIDLGKATTTGWELVAAADVITNQALQWNAKLTWGKIEPHVDDDGYFDFIDPTPEWRAGLLNQFHFNKWLFSILIDSRYQGGLYYDRMIGGEPVRKGEIDLQAKLRDASAAYTLFTKPKTSGLALNKLMLSVSARNILTIYSSIKADSEAVANFYSAQKNVSLSITANF